MWNEPYLETCCRSALHRLLQCGRAGRPDGLKDGRCLVRLAELGLAELMPEDTSRFRVTDAGRARHRSEIMKKAA
ncbi:hypothetical protein [Rhizosaccharibacter radicis]|uniref:Uncharacterized protein n=1 Tax=Rhizosaccharibacter radicis TaxID=2782605 RepID=A0ABT1W0S4_9PROT|nr:hypothetical protein [Acetobacteraceae bacterium KSS12]